MKKAKSVVRFLVIVVIAALVICLLQRNLGLKNDNNAPQKSFSEGADKSISEEEILQEQYDATIKKAEEFKSSITSNTEIILLSISDRYIISQDRTPDNNLLTEWLLDSAMKIEVRYTAIFSIPTEAIEVEWDKEKINVYYDPKEITVKSINIDNIFVSEKRSIFGKAFTPSETSAITIVATKQIWQQIAANTILNFIAQQNLEAYIRNQSLRMLLFNVNVYSL